MVSVIVLSWNARDEIVACVDSLLEASKIIPLEIIVIDNASGDDSVAYLEKYSDIKLVKNNTNRLYAGGNNQGYSLTKADLVLLLNQDTIVNGPAIKAMSDWLMQHPNYGGATVKLLNLDGSTQYHMHRRLPHWYDIPLGLLHKRIPAIMFNTTKKYLYLDNKFDQDFDIEQAAGACLMVRRTAIAQLGVLFDEPHFPLYYNDVDLCYRLHKAGWPIRCLTSVSIMHRKGTSVRKLPKWKNMKIYLRSLFYYFARFK
ncbi:MAG: glycosyltransferase family 2 protein [Patescibacteria group bacterium]|jgi:hypothetical protein